MDLNKSYEILLKIEPHLIKICVNIREYKHYKRVDNNLQESVKYKMPSIYMLLSVIYYIILTRVPIENIGTLRPRQAYPWTFVSEITNFKFQIIIII